MKKQITIKEIQEWEKSFTKKKGISQKEQKAVMIAILKLMEETGEVAKAVLEGNWKEVPAEVSDVIVFACKVANIAEEFHNSEDLTSVIKKKLEYCKGRTYDSGSKKFDKQKNKEFK